MEVLNNNNFYSTSQYPAFIFGDNNNGKQIPSSNSSTPSAGNSLPSSPNSMVPTNNNSPNINSKPNNQNNNQNNNSNNKNQTAKNNYSLINTSGVGHWRKCCYSSKCLLCNKGTPRCLMMNHPSWTLILRVVFFSLTTIHPDKEFFNLKKEVYLYLNEHWEILSPTQKQSNNWKRQVQDALSHSRFFRSGRHTLRCNGYWQLKLPCNPWNYNNSKQFEALRFEEGCSGSHSPSSPTPSSTQLQSNSVCSSPSHVSQQEYELESSHQQELNRKINIHNSPQQQQIQQQINEFNWCYEPKPTLQYNERPLKRVNTRMTDGMTINQLLCLGKESLELSEQSDFDMYNCNTNNNASRNPIAMSNSISSLSLLNCDNKTLNHNNFSSLHSLLKPLSNSLNSSNNNNNNSKYIQYRSYESSPTSSPSLVPSTPEQSYDHKMNQMKSILNCTM